MREEIYFGYQYYLSQKGMDFLLSYFLPRFCEWIKPVTTKNPACLEFRKAIHQN